MEKILNEILSKLNTVENSLQDIKQGQTRIEEKINNIDEIIEFLQHENLDIKQDVFTIKNKLGPNNQQITDMTELSKDIKFIKYKLHKAEEDVFDIKDHLKIIK